MAEACDRYSSEEKYIDLQGLVEEAKDTRKLGCVEELLILNGS
jgi:hypothetical protein